MDPTAISCCERRKSSSLTLIFGFVTSVVTSYDDINWPLRHQVCSELGDKNAFGQTTVAFSRKPEIRLELKLEHRNISQIRLELDYRHFALI